MRSIFAAIAILFLLACSVRADEAKQQQPLYADVADCPPFKYVNGVKTCAFVSDLEKTVKDPGKVEYVCKMDDSEITSARTIFGLAMGTNTKNWPLSYVVPSPDCPSKGWAKIIYTPISNLVLVVKTGPETVPQKPTEPEIVVVRVPIYLLRKRIIVVTAPASPRPMFEYLPTIPYGSWTYWVVDYLNVPPTLLQKEAPKQPEKTEAIPLEVPGQNLYMLANPPPRPKKRPRMISATTAKATAGRVSQAKSRNPLVLAHRSAP
jgi:hypothetical protein